MYKSQTTVSLGLLLLLSAAATSYAQYTPLTSRRYTYPNLPYKVDTDSTGRGPQSGYNICNSTTQGPTSMCQTAILNNITDFCLWGPKDPGSTISDEEAATVAFCTKNGHGARTMPAGTITGVQVLKAPDYILFAGTIKQSNVDIVEGDTGGEMDPHGDDQRGNPLGGLVYSTGFPSSNGQYQQVIEWHNFMGSDIFCFKICDPSVSTSAQYCNNVFDRTGCQFVAPASYAEGTFESCDSANQDPVGVYVTNGQTLTYSQPPEGVDITSLPTVRTPASSNCQTFSSASLFTDAAGASSSGSSSASGSSSSSGSSATSSASGSSASSVSSRSSASTGSNASSSSSRSVAPASSSSSSSSSPSNAAVAGGGSMIASVGYGPFVAIAFSVVLGAVGVLVA